MHSRIAIVIILATLAGAAAGHATEQAPPVPAEEQPEVLTQGPVNEAFAQPINLDDRDGFVAPQEPPPAIDEVPPPERPQGDQYAWVPGYWAWDTDRNGYIWVSGCWRAVPPGMSWVPGYWSPTAGGWRWVAGFWAPVEGAEMEYLPPPPDLTDISPPGPPPAPDRIWVPPCWYWHRGGYVWRPGYWLVAQSDWVWIPSCYVWTPRGYVFVRGHWDYAVERRGLLFAPVYFPRPLYRRPGYAYTLSIAIDLGNLQFGLFTRPRYCHYYFGDYYDSAYVAVGIFPWYEFEHRHGWYDPIYAHARWRHRRDPHWERNQHREYDRRRNDRSLRPPHTYREMERLPTSRRLSARYAVPVSRMASDARTPFRIDSAGPEKRQQLTRHANDVRTYGEKRRQWESQATPWSGGRPASETAPQAVPGKKAPPAGGEARQPARPSDKPSANDKQSTPGRQMHRQPVTSPAFDPGRTMPRASQQQPSATPAQKGLNRTDRVIFRPPPVADKPSGEPQRKGHPFWPREENKGIK